MNDTQLQDKIQNPLKYIEKDKAWIPNYSGSLLAWLSHSLNEQGYQCSGIDHVVTFKRDDTEAYEFTPEEFDFHFQSKRGTIKEIESCIDRFIMKDKAVFIVETCDGETRPTQLNLVEPVVIPSSLKKGLGELMRREIR